MQQTLTKMDKTPEDALSIAKISLMAKTNSAFFTELAFNLQHKFDDRISTAATNGKRIIYNAKFFMDLHPQERVFLILHEVLHCAFLHIDRAKNFNKTKYNIAADYVINNHLIEAGYKMPDCGLADPQYSGMTTEQVYALLPESDCVGGFGEDLEDPGSSEQAQADVEEMKDLLIRAEIKSKLAGDKSGIIPGEIQIFIDSLLQPKLPWNRILMKYLHGVSRHDYSMRRPNRRYMPEYYLPTLFSESLGGIAIAVDTSGSVSDADFSQFITETSSIIRSLRPEHVDFIQFDCSIKSISRVKNIRQLKNINFTGRGGTCISEVCTWASTHKPKVILFFTDGEFFFPSENIKGVNVIWLIHNNKAFKAPYGKVIHYELSNGS